MPIKTPGAVETNLENDVSILYGLSRRVSNSIRGAIDGWFGPYDPIPQVAPKGTPVRVLDYPIGYNINIAPRAGETITFHQLRALADSHDITRLAIETRKDQVAKIPISFRLRDVAGKTGKAMKEATANDKRIDALNDFFRYPDREHTFSTWTRLLLEDLMVIDAPTIYPRMTKGGEVYSLDVIDGATICRKIDTQARTPMPPDVAYQQIIKGMPTVDLTADDIIYRPRNMRPNRFYGFSPVEQIVITINTALRRQLQQLFHFTDGNIPEALMMVDGDWTPDQIEQFQKAFDSYMSLQNRSKMKMGPKGQYVSLKPIELKTDFDEWMARVVCFAFSLPPTAFIRQMNRATAGTAQETALEEGLIPVMQWLKEVLDYAIAKYWKWPDIEAYWGDERQDDPKETSDMVVAHVKVGLITENEGRAKLGYDASDDPDADRLGIITATGYVPLTAPPQQDSAEAGSQPPDDNNKSRRSASADKLSALDYAKKKVSRQLLQ